MISFIYLLEAVDEPFQLNGKRFCINFFAILPQKHNPSQGKNLNMIEDGTIFAMRVRGSEPWSETFTYACVFVDGYVRVFWWTVTCVFWWTVMCVCFLGWWCACFFLDGDVRVFSWKVMCVCFCEWLCACVFVDCDVCVFLRTVMCMCFCGWWCVSFHGWWSACDFVDGDVHILSWIVMCVCFRRRWCVRVFLWMAMCVRTRSRGPFHLLRCFSSQVRNATSTVPVMGRLWLFSIRLSDPRQWWSLMATKQR